jgi:hypothetical protein
MLRRRIAARSAASGQGRRRTAAEEGKRLSAEVRMRVLQDAFDGNGRRLPVQAGCAGAAQYRAEQEVQAAQIRLGRAPVAGIIMLMIGVRLRRQAFVDMPDRMGKRAMLRGEQRQDASQLQ